MNINLASFIDRLPEVNMNTAPDMAKTATQLQQSNKHQVGAINNDFLNDLTNSRNMLGAAIA